MTETQPEGLAAGLFVTGFTLGLIIGPLALVIRALRAGRQPRQVREPQVKRQVSPSKPTLADPAIESAAEGRAAARRRRSELGIGAN